MEVRAGMLAVSELAGPGIPVTSLEWTAALLKQYQTNRYTITGFEPASGPGAGGLLTVKSPLRSADHDAGRL